MSTAVTKRIGGQASGGETKRVNAGFHTSLLLLEGDQSGYLYLEGDAVTDQHDKLLLDGDQVEANINLQQRVGSTSITSSITKRVA